MRLAYQFQGQTVKGQDGKRSGAYHVGRTRRPLYLFTEEFVVDHIYSTFINNMCY